jgi:hypothetical protein
MSLFQVSGNILDTPPGELLLQQCNCTTKTMKGLSQTIFSKYPWANTYTSGYVRTPGNVSIHEKAGSPIIVNLYAQMKPGKPSGIETSHQRMVWMVEALTKLRDKYPTKDIHVPYNMGCGYAGGIWDDYLIILESYVKESERKVYIHKL